MSVSLLTGKHFGHLYAFGDAGLLELNDGDAAIDFGKLRASAGFGSALTIKRWGRFSMASQTFYAKSSMRARCSSFPILSRSL
jgi:hypothetical protein